MNKILEDIILTAMPPVTRKKVMRSTYHKHLVKLTSGFQNSDKTDIVSLKAFKKSISEGMVTVKNLDNKILETIENEDDIAEEMSATLIYSDEVTKTLTQLESPYSTVGKIGPRSEADCTE